MGTERDERRQAPRIAVELRVEFKHLGRPLETYADLSRDISAGGVFVETSVGLELGTEVALEIAPGPGAAPIRMRAEVVRIEEDVATTGSKLTARTKGMALRFFESESAEANRLLALARQMQREKSHGNGTSPPVGRKR